MLNCHDCRGRTVTMSQRQWEVHIVARRPFMSEYLGAVRSTIRTPDFICSDADHASREAFYALGTIDDYPDEWMKVIVEFDADHFGTVITAYLTDKPKAGEVQIWPQ